MGHGDHWAAIERDSTEFIAEMLPRICSEGKLIGKNAFTHSMEDVPNKVGIAFGLQYADTPLNFLVLVVGEIEEDSNLLWSGYPVCADGIKCRIVIEAIKAWDNGIEGTIEAYIPEGGIISFFDPYFFLNKESYIVGKEVTVKLGALAYTLQKADQLEIQITEGPMLEIHRQRLLEDDPDVDVSAVTSVPISMDGSAIYFPRGDDGDDAEIRFKVTETDSFICAERSFKRVSGIIMRPDSGDVNIHVYVSDQVLGGYIPQIGDNVDAIVWMQGYLVTDDEMVTDNEIKFIETVTHPENEQKCIRRAQEVRLQLLNAELQNFIVWRYEIPNALHEFRTEVEWRPDFWGKVMQASLLPLVFMFKWLVFMASPILYVVDICEKYKNRKILKNKIQDIENNMDSVFDAPEEKTLDHLWRYYGLDEKNGEESNFQLLGEWVELLYGNETRKRVDFEQLKAEIHKRQAEANNRSEPDAPHYHFIDIAWAVAKKISSMLPPYKKI